MTNSCSLAERRRNRRYSSNQKRSRVRRGQIKYIDELGPKPRRGLWWWWWMLLLLLLLAGPEDSRRCSAPR